MTNGIAAARAIEPISPVRLWLLADTIRILILVWDANPHQPAPAQADEYAESGRGLLLVQALSRRWGSAGRGRGHGSSDRAGGQATAVASGLAQG